MSNWIGHQIGKVRIERLLGRGGVAEVYLGTHTTLDRPVAVKVLQRRLDGAGDQLERLQREARVVAGLRHPNIVTVYDFDIIDDQPYIVMEYVPGPSLSSYLGSLHTRGARMPLALIARLIPALASALDYAHRQGVIHRDVKPGNVLLLSRSGPIRPGEALPGDVEPVLTDFGLVRLLGSASQTTSGMVTGTPGYMSPEQARGDALDGRSDTYALGVMLYEMLAGRLPFEAESMLAVLHKHLNEAPPPVPGLPANLQAVLDRALQKDPAARYQSPGALADGLLTALGRPTVSMPALSFDDNAPTLAPTPPPTLPPAPAPRRSSRWTYAAGAAVLMGILGLAGWLLRPSAPEPPPAMPVEADMQPAGLLRFHDVSATLDEVTLSASSMLPAPAGFQYEVWLVSGEERRSLGALPVDAGGRGELNFIDLQGRNLLELYDRIEISLEPSPDPSPNPSGQVAYSSGLPAEALAHVRHLLVGFARAPGRKALAFGLVEQAGLVDQAASEMVAAYQAGDADDVQRAAEAIHNLLVGPQGVSYGDLNADGQISDPGDGYGLLLNGDNAGYIEATMSHAVFAASASDATDNIQEHAVHVMIAAGNVEQWAAELSSLLPQIVADPLGGPTRDLVLQAAALADRILNGRDLDGDERVEAIAGEGGARTALGHAYYLADMPLLPGSGMLPPPAPPFEVPASLEYTEP